MARGEPECSHAGRGTTGLAVSDNRDLSAASLRRLMDSGRPPACLPADSPLHRCSGGSGITFLRERLGGATLCRPATLPARLPTPPFISPSFASSHRLPTGRRPPGVPGAPPELTSLLPHWFNPLLPTVASPGPPRGAAQVAEERRLQTGGVVLAT